MKKLTVTLGILILTQIMSYANAASNYKILSLFLYKFTQYIEWPNTSGDFVIGVYGNGGMTEELQALAASKKVGERKIVVKKLSSATEATTCAIVFLTESSTVSESSISEKIGKSPVLVISEKSGTVKKGAGISFDIVDNKMKFDLNKSMLEKQGLKISGSLIQLAASVI